MHPSCLVEAERGEEIPLAAEGAVEPSACCPEIPRRLRSLDRPAWDLPRVQITSGSVKARHALSWTPLPLVPVTYWNGPHEDRPSPGAEFQGFHLRRPRLRLPVAIERPSLDAERRQILARRSVDLGESSASVEFAIACFARIRRSCRPPPAARKATTPQLWCTCLPRPSSSSAYPLRS